MLAPTVTDAGYRAQS